MNYQCTRCRSHAINPHLHGRDFSDLSLCDVCYWRKRAESTPPQPDRAVMQQALEALVKARFDSLNMSLADMREVNSAADALRAALSATKDGEPRTVDN